MPRIPKQVLSGTITLYNAEGRRLAYRHYAHTSKRAKILREWNVFYPNFQTYHYHITPDYDPEGNIPGITIKQKQFLETPKY